MKKNEKDMKRMKRMKRMREIKRDGENFFLREIIVKVKRSSHMRYDFRRRRINRVRISSN